MGDTADVLINSNADSAWKDILDFYFKDFLDYCLPEMSELIDWNIPWVSLDKELLAITKDGVTGRRLVDKLFKVFLKSGHEQWVLFHIEIQGNVDKELPKRMFLYAARIYDKYQKPLASCAILTDDKKNFRPNHFEVALGASKLSLDFILIKLIDYENRYKELDKSKNPFASVILSQLEALKAKQKSPQERFNIKLNLTKRLFKKGYNKNEVIKMYRFIDWLVQLPKELEVDFKQTVYDLKEATHMPYISTIERMGIEQGRQEGALIKMSYISTIERMGIEQGRKEGKKEGRGEGILIGQAKVLIRLITQKFGAISSRDRKRIEQASAEDLTVLTDKFLTATTIAEIFDTDFVPAD